MDKQSYQFPNRNTQFVNPRTTGPYKQSIPEKKISNDLILKLFSEVASGNYLKLKEFLLANQLSMTSRSETSESVLHLIISNSNITQKEKLQLATFAIKEGAPVNLASENNVTPLHLACKYQLYDVIVLLLENGAVIDFFDSQFKTALHYAISGESTQCLSNDDTKVKPLIPKSHIKKKEIESNESIVDLQTNLKKFLTTNSSTKNYIINIKNTLDNVEKMYPIDFKKMISATQETIANTIVDKSIIGDKSKAIFEKVMADKKKMLDFVLSKVGDGIAPLEIKPGIYEGWGPNQYQANRVLKYGELSEFLTDMHLSADNEIQEANDDSAKLQNLIETELNNLRKMVGNFSDVIQYSHYYCNVIGTHINNIDMTNLTALRDLLFTQDPTKPIDSTILQYPGKIFPDRVVGDERFTNMTKPTWNYVANKETQLIPERFYLQLDQMKTMGIFRPAGGFILKNPVMPRISANEYEDLKRRGIYADILPLTVEVPLAIGSNPYLPADVQLLEFKYSDDVLVYIRNGVQVLGSRGLYFDTPTKILVALLDWAMARLKLSLNEISMKFSEKHFHEAYLSINECLTHVLSLLLTVSEINKEIPTLRDHFNRLKLFFDDKKNQLIAIRGEHYGFLTEQISNEISNVISNHVDTLNYACDSFYGTTINVVKLLNKYLVAMQKSSTATIFDSYYKTDNFDRWYDAEQCNQFENIIVNNPIELIPEPPTNLIDFRKLKSENMADTKTTLITRFVSQISTNNLISFYMHLLPIPNSLPKLGFIQLFANLNPDDGDNFNPDINTPLEAVRKLNTTTHVYDNILQIKELQRRNGNPDAPFMDPDANLIGYAGKINIIPTNKSKAIEAVAGSDLNLHLIMLKYSIVRKIITLVHKYLTHLANPAILDPFADPKYASIKDSITKVTNQIKSLVPFEESNYSFLFVLIGKYVDEVLINMITEIINNKVSKIALRLVESEKSIPRSYLDDLERTIIFSNKDVGFGVNMTKLFDETLKKYTNGKFVMSRKFGLIASGDLNDPPKQESTIVKLINFNHTINSIEKACFKVDPKIVELLLKKGAYVNSKDIIGNTPIYYAIEMQNKDIVDLLLNNGAVVYNQHFNNKFGKNILENTWENYALIVNTLMANKYAVCDTLTKNLLEKFSKQSNYKNNIPKYSDILLSISLYMLNHQLYTFGKGYPNKWSFKKNTELEQLLNLDTHLVLPLLNDAHMTDTEISRLEMSNLYIAQLEKSINDNKQKIKELTTKKKNIVDEEREITNINAVNRTENDTKRLYEIAQINTDIDTKIMNLNHQITTDQQLLNGIKTAKTNAYSKLKKFIKTHEHKLVRSSDNVVDTYESVFKNVINGDNRILNNVYNYVVDIKTYPMIWKKFIQETKKTLENCSCQSASTMCKHDYTQILDNIFCYQQKILADNRVSEIKLKSLNMVVDYYDNVIYPFVTDYFDLPREYNSTENYALSQVIDIIVHIVKRFVCVTLFGTIMKALTNYVIMEFPYNPTSGFYKNEKEYQDYILNLIIGVINDKGVDKYGSRLLSYIFDTIPTKIVKIVLQIFNGPDPDSDPDKLTSVEEIFDHINKILESTSAINLPTNNSLTSGLKLYVFPYYGDYLELFIKEMFNLLSNYLRSLQYQTKTLKILQSVSLKASQEMARQVP